MAKRSRSGKKKNPASGHRLRTPSSEPASPSASGKSPRGRSKTVRREDAASPTPSLPPSHIQAPPGRSKTPHGRPRRAEATTPAVAGSLSLPPQPALASIKPISTASASSNTSTASNSSAIEDIDDMQFLVAAKILAGIQQIVTEGLNVISKIDDFYKPAKDLLSLCRRAEARINKGKAKGEQLQETFLSFSKIKQAALRDRLGVKDIRLVRKDALAPAIEGCEQKFPTYFPTTDGEPLTLYDPSSWDHKALAAGLETWEKRSVNWNEAAARLHVNCWLDMSSRQVAATAKTFSVVIFPEYPMATKRREITSNEDNATEQPMSDIFVTHGDYSTYLTGFPDFLCLIDSSTLPLDSEDDLHDVDRDVNWLQTFVEESLEDRSGSIVLRDIYHAKPTTRSLVIETKSVKEDLIKHLPQVIAQAFAVTRLSNEAKNVSFILTNGQEWIFGVVHTTTDSYCSPTVFVSESYKITYDLVQQGLNSDSTHSFYHQFIRTLLTWIKVDPAKLVQEIEAATASHDLPQVYKW